MVPQLVLVGVLVLVNAAFTGTEMALVSLREGQLQQLEQRSATGALVARLARDPNNFLATTQVYITLAGFLASAAARPLAVLSTLSRPVVWLLSVSTNVLVRLAGGDPDVQRAAVTEAELRE